MKKFRYISLILCVALVVSVLNIGTASAAAKYTAYSTTKKATTTANLIMRTGPSTDNSKIVTIPKGKTVTVYGYYSVTGDDWYKVKYDGKTGCSISTYMKLVSNANASKINGSSIAYPTSIRKGSGFYVKGKLSSTYKLTYVRVGVKNSAGNWVKNVNSIAKPNAKAYDLSKLDSKIYFNKLGEGQYKYVVYAKDSKGYTKTVLSKSFTVRGTESKVTVSSLVAPSSLTVGTTFAAKGTLNSNYKMTYIKVGVKNASKKWMSGYYAVAEPDVYTYKIDSLASKIKFQNLSAGTYYFAVYVKDSKGKAYTKVSKEFTVKKVDAQSNITITDHTAPVGKYSEGSYFTFKGNIVSKYKLKNVEVGVVDENNKKVEDCYETAQPQTLSYAVSKLDSKLSFNKIEEGQYTYRIIAEDVKGKEKVLVDQGFTITEVKGGSADMVSAGKILSYNKTIFKKIGKQPFSGPCGLYAMAYGRLVIDGTFKFKTGYGSVCDQLISDYGQGSVIAHWNMAGAKSEYTSTHKAAYQEVLREINAGRPAIIPVTGRYGNHFVTVIGYAPGTTMSNVTLSKLIILDPAYGDQCAGNYHDGYRDCESSIRCIKFYE